MADQNTVPTSINTSMPIVSAKTNTIQNSLATGVSDRLGKPWVVSDQLLPFLGVWENGVENGKNFAHQMVVDGFILKVYYDSKKLPTVGCGHLVVTSDKLKVGEAITKDKAKELLKKYLSTAEKAINNKVKVPLHKHEYDALVSIAFNTGAAGVSKLADSVNKGKYEAIPAEIRKYRTGGGNEGRRASEAKLFESGVYDASH